jgi:hypothetical protein
MIQRTLALVLLLAGTVLAGGITIGNNDGGNCYPYLCFASDGGTAYQQQFRAGAFTGPIDIGSFSLFHDPTWANGSAVMDPATFVITFATSAVPFRNMSPNFADNLGPDAAVFGTYHFQGQMPEVLTIAGTSFHYDPANGDLLMSLAVTSDGGSGCPYCTGFLADQTGTDTLRSFSYLEPGSVTVNDTGAPLTNFNGVFDGATTLGSGGTLGSAAPEPAPLGLMGFGLACLIWHLRRRPA